MSKLTVDEVRGRSVAREQEQEQLQVRRRQELHQSSQFDRNGPATVMGIGKTDLSALGNGTTQSLSDKPRFINHTFTNGQRIDIPRLTERQQVVVDEAFARLAPSSREKLQKILMDLGKAAWDEDEAKPNGIEVNSVSTDLQDATNMTYEQWMMSEGNDQRDGASETLIFEGVWGVEKNLHNFFFEVAEREQFGNETRAYVNELEAMLADWPDDGSTETFSYREITIGEDGKATIVDHKDEQLTKEEAQKLLDRLEPQAEAIASVVNQDIYKLQYMVERYQQLTSTLSNILKNQDDTRKGIINNIRA
ncbi:MAG: hypothetical protein A2289_05175 [Deltaproteobacteria bacterium RIFOXYA12_FULL_58_15]|nr:MAG: hypothetical protein A2289_05175 [Deltaproteobacteria bacterium RIFOXYA12_FULL_58_15]OGR08568.1 MAG: hypothetical protein A2341_25510 [Deltaproteobacteria bacterium RIFOXYB12_FULL_58_9]